MQIITPTRQQSASTQGFMDYLTKLCQANSEHSVSIYVHNVDLADVPDYFIKSSFLNNEGSVAHKVAKGDNSGFTVNVFYK
jgi:hypothetical protein